MANTCISLYDLHTQVAALGGPEVVSASRNWRRIAAALGMPADAPNVTTKLKQAYQRYLAAYDVGLASGDVSGRSDVSKSTRPLVNDVDAGAAMGGHTSSPEAAHAQVQPQQPPPMPAALLSQLFAQLPQSAPPAADRQTVRCGVATCGLLLAVPAGTTRFKCGTCGTLQGVSFSG